MSTDTLKTAICDALAAFVRQRPGFDYANYGDAASYRADSRTATLHKRDAETLLAAVRWRDSISGADILDAARGGRLTITVEPRHTEAQELAYESQRASGGILERPPAAGFRVRVDYCTGQYWPTEFRAGVCRVLSSALWNWQREAMPVPTRHHNSETGEDVERFDGMRAGDWLRAKFRREFGSSLARRWFN
jgi:hypothetical protein